MKWRVGKVPISNVVIVAVLSLLIYGYVERSRRHERSRYYSQKMKAAQFMSLFEHTIREAKEARGIAIDEINDPNLTGIIGPEFTVTTTDRGNLTAKLTTTNPNFAAVIVDMLKSCKLKKGDVVAVGETGSLIGLNLAVYAALEALQLRPIIIVSLGSSMWGATDPDFTWLDMVGTLREKELIRFKPVAASLGGGRDMGRGLSRIGRDKLESAIKRSGAAFIHEPTLEESISKRMKVYRKRSKGKKIKAYINVGGGVASLGSVQNGRLIPSGVSRRLGLKDFPADGVIIKMAKRGIPVIHFLNVNKVAERYDMPEAPVPMPEIGEGAIFFKERYDITATVLGLIALCILTFLLLRVDIRYYLTRIRHRNSGI